MPRSSLLRRLSRRLHIWMGILLCAVLVSHCADEPSGPTRSGGLALTLRYPDWMPNVGAADSMRITVLDADGEDLIPLVSAHLPPDGEIDLSLDVPEGVDRTIRLEIDGDGYRGRGLLASGEVHGVEVRSHRTTEVTVPITVRVPEPEEIQVVAGDVDYRLHWPPVDGADSYEVLTEEGSSETSDSVSDTTLTFDLHALLAGGEDARVVHRVRARFGDRSSVFGDSVSVDKGAITDLPRVLSVDPIEGAELVRDDISIELEFSHLIDPGSITSKNPRLEVESTGELLPTTVAPTEVGIALTPTAILPSGADVRVVVEPGIADLDGRPFDQDPNTPGLQSFESSFGVAVYDPLRVVSVDPDSGSVGVSILPTVVLDFNIAFDSETLARDVVELTDQAGVRKDIRLDFNDEQTELTMIPFQPLLYEATYKVIISPGLLDLNGDSFDQDPTTPRDQLEPFQSEFTTEVQPVGPRVLSVLPADSEPNAASFEPVVVTFSRPMNPSTVQSPSSFKVRQNQIFNISGTVSSDETAQIFTFTPDASLIPDTDYTVIVTPEALDAKGIPLDQDPETSGFQEFRSDFHVERTLQITSVSPANRQERVPLEASVRVDFSLPADPESVTEETLILETGGVPVIASRSVSSNRRFATLIPDAPMTTFTDYRVRASSGLLSEEGGRLDQDPEEAGHQEFVSFFTTRPESIPPMVVGVIPKAGSDGLEPRPILEVIFSKPILPGSVNSETYLLRPVGGAAISGEINIRPDSLVAWFLPDQDLLLSAEHEIEVTTWVVDRFDTRLDQDPEMEGRQPFLSRFTTDHERVSPTVAGVSPTDGAEDVSATASVVITFDEPMASAPLVTGGALRVSQGATSIPGTVELSPDLTVATFVPSESYPLDRTLSVFVDTTATDSFGNRLDQNPATEEKEPFTSSFQTEPDQAGPFVVAVAPTDGTVGVEPSERPEVLFSEPVDTLSVLTGVELRDSLGVAVEAAIEFLGTTQIRIVPSEDLAADTRFTLFADSTVVDSIGNPLDQDPKSPGLSPFSSTFRTRVENEPPRAIGAWFDEEPPPVDTRIWVAFTEPMDPSSLGQENVTLTVVGGAETPVSAMFVSADTLVIDLVEDLDPATGYELTVEGLTDLVGNVLDQFPETEEPEPFVKLFTTANDLVPPRVESSEPSEGQTGVGVDQVIHVFFSEAMDTTTTNEDNLRLVLIDGNNTNQVETAIEWESDRRNFHLDPDTDLLYGREYQIQATLFLRDEHGNNLDQDPKTPGQEEFFATFQVGEFPVAEAGPSFCDEADTTYVEVDFSGSFDPDGQIVLAEINWGDGVEELVVPDSVDWLLGHDYPCLDFAGCDQLDNDGDGETDETSRCDESYRIILRVQDDQGLWSSDTTGVSFCSFGALEADPIDGATDVDTLLTEVRIEFTRAVADSSLTGDNFHLLESGVDSVGVSNVTYGIDDHEVVLTLVEALKPATSYEIQVSTAVVDDEGRPLDQDPCIPAAEPFSSQFSTLAAMRPARNHPATGSLPAPK